MQKLRFLLGILFIVLLNPLQAEIQSLIVRWNPTYCSTACAMNLQMQFSRVFSASKVEFNAQAGEAVLYWKPYAVFTYQQIAAAMNMVGYRAYDIRLRVRGTISHDRTNFYLTSIGDNTVFTLMSPANSVSNQMSTPYYNQSSPYASYYNIPNQQAVQDLRNQLLLGEQSGQLVVIEGPLYEPWRYINMNLVIEQMQFVQ
jgi:hypothetical protein